jgi:hypothetical protein
LDEPRNKQQDYADICIRNTVEGKFGIGKKAYGLGRIMANHKATANTVINLAFLAMNLVKRMAFYAIFCNHKTVFFVGGF